MSRAGSSPPASTTMTSRGGSWVTRLSRRAAMFRASLRTVVTAVINNGRRVRSARLSWFRDARRVPARADGSAAPRAIFYSGPRILATRPPSSQVASTIREVAPVTSAADLVIVHGDTNTTLAGAVLANKQAKALAHVEAGIRSFDRTMPEEINRTVTDHLADHLFAPTETARANLRRENVTRGVHVVGNSVIDALTQNTRTAEARSTILRDLGLSKGQYVLLTFHRQENVDRPGPL